MSGTKFINEIIGGNIAAAFSRALVTSYSKLTKAGWLRTVCPACDHASSLLLTPTGGFRYLCFNKSCESKLAFSFGVLKPRKNRG
jgi:hypothetical protein